MACRSVDGDRGLGGTGVRRRRHDRGGGALLGVGALVIGGTTKRDFTALVFFHGGIERAPWKIFTRQGWRHCFIVQPGYFPKPSLTATKVMVVVDPQSWGTAVDWYVMDEDELVSRFYAMGGTAVVRYRVRTPPDRMYVRRGLHTCVTWCKSVLAVRAWWVWSPRALYSYLIRHGGEVVGRE